MADTNEYAWQALPADDGLQVALAARLVRSAWLGEEDITLSPLSLQHWSTHHSRLRSLSRLWSQVSRYSPYVAWALMAVSFFERPYWCRRLGGRCAGHGGTHDKYPNAGLIVHTTWITSVIAAILWCLLALECVLSALVSQLAKRVCAIALTVSLLDLVGVVAVTGFQSPVTCLARLSVVLCYDRILRTQLAIVLRVIPELCALCILLGLALGAYAWFGTLLWRDRTAQGREIFTTYPQSLWQLLITITTANFPDVMMRAYAANRAAFFFFGSFVILSLYVLLNMVLAVVADAYSRSKQERASRLAQQRTRLLDAALDVLHLDSAMSQPRFLQLLNELDIDETQARLAFGVLDDDGTGVVSREAFRTKLTQVLNAKFSPKPAAPKCVVPPDWLVDILLCANLIFEAVVERHALSGQDDDENARRSDGRPDTPAQIVSSCFAACYVVEIAWKAVAYGGFGAYFRRSFRDAFDLVTTLASVAATLWVFVPNGFDDADAIRYALLLRTLRLARLVEMAPAFRRVSASFRRVVPTARDLARSLIFIGLCFASIGCLVFGGKISPERHRIERRAPDFSSAADVGYYANSMNDLGSAMVLLFELLVVNNWYVLVEGYVAAVDSKWARVFFVCWWIVGVLTLLNVLVAATLDSFISEYDNTSQPVQIDASSITGTTTGLPTALYDLQADDAELLDSLRVHNAPAMSQNAAQGRDSTKRSLLATLLFDEPPSS